MGWGRSTVREPQRTSGSPSRRSNPEVPICWHTQWNHGDGMTCVGYFVHLTSTHAYQRKLQPRPLPERNAPAVCRSRPARPEADLQMRCVKALGSEKNSKAPSPAGPVRNRT